MSLGWAARLHCEDVPQQFFDDMGRRAQSLINRVEDKEEKRQMYCLLAGIQMQ